MHTDYKYTVNENDSQITLQVRMMSSLMAFVPETDVGVASVALQEHIEKCIHPALKYSGNYICIWFE